MSWNKINAHGIGSSNNIHMYKMWNKEYTQISIFILRKIKLNREERALPFGISVKFTLLSQQQEREFAVVIYWCTVYGYAIFIIMRFWPVALFTVDPAKWKRKTRTETAKILDLGFFFFFVDPFYIGPRSLFVYRLWFCHAICNTNRYGVAKARARACNASSDVCMRYVSN